MVMVSTAGSGDIETARKFLADAILLLARIDETCRNNDHAKIAKKFVFSNHVNEAFKTLLATDKIERLEAGLVLTIIHQHLTEELFSLLNFNVVRTIEEVLMRQLPKDHATHEALNSVA